jgi:hypothetical protein
MLIKNSVRRGWGQGAQRLSMDQQASRLGAKHLSVADRTNKHELQYLVELGNLKLFLV